MAKKKYDTDIVGWFYRNGHRIPVRDKKLIKKGMYQHHKDIVQDLADINKYKDGTYDISTMKTKEFDDGYQVTFWQIGDDYSEREYAELAIMMCNMSSDGKVWAGAFTDGGVRAPEISWHFKDRDEAVRIGEQYNQVNVFDWKAYQRALVCEKKYGSNDPRTTEAWNKCFIATGGTGRRKP